MRVSRGHILLVAASALSVGALACVGCGTTRSTDTSRTATEQLLISDAIDRAVQSVNLQTLAGQSVYLDDSRLGDVVDRNYLVSTLRQHLLASGCALRAERDQADFVVEARAGAVGTDRNDLLFGIPSMNVPQILPVQPVAAAIPEVPFAKRRDQRGIAKIAVFAYHRETGMPVWQSGIAHQESSANDVWILGAGPFQRGTIYDGTAFAGKTLGNEDKSEDGGRVPRPPIGLANENTFNAPQHLAKQTPAAQSAEQAVVPAVHHEPLSSATDSAAAIPQNNEPAPLPAAARQAGDQRASAAVLAQENEELRAMLSGAATVQDQEKGGISARVYEVPPSRHTGVLNATMPFARPVDPVPLPQPRFNSP